MDKWDYIRELSNMSDKYEDKLLILMDTYRKNNLVDITLDEARDFYNHISK